MLSCRASTDRPRPAFPRDSRNCRGQRGDGFCASFIRLSAPPRLVYLPRSSTAAPNLDGSISLNSYLRFPGGPLVAGEDTSEEHVSIGYSSVQVTHQLPAVAEPTPNRRPPPRFLVPLLSSSSSFLFLPGDTHPIDRPKSRSGPLPIKLVSGLLFGSFGGPCRTVSPRQMGRTTCPPGGHRLFCFLSAFYHGSPHKYTAITL